ncbi:MAG: MarR transcriptional [Planctomycetota bacterium]|nr:MAG: MarR transcriptional [Planctomycetota bacterium]
MKTLRPPDPRLNELSFWLGRAYYNYVGLLERVLEDLGLDDRLRPGMGHALFALFERDDRSIKDLVARTALSPSTLTGMLDRMERHGVVERHADPADGRVVRVRLTASGKALEPRCRGALKRVNGVLGAGLSAAQIRKLKQSLSTIVGSMKRDERAWKSRRDRIKQEEAV